MMNNDESNPTRLLEVIRERTGLAEMSEGESDRILLEIKAALNVAYSQVDSDARALAFAMSELGKQLKIAAETWASQCETRKKAVESAICAALCYGKATVYAKLISQNWLDQEDEWQGKEYEAISLANTLIRGK